MRWITFPPLPEADQRRIVRRFAWLPTGCEGNITVWLEPYFVFQVYKKAYGDERNHYDGWWRTETIHALEPLPDYPPL